MNVLVISNDSLRNLALHSLISKNPHVQGWSTLPCHAKQDWQITDSPQIKLVIFLDYCTYRHSPIFRKDRSDLRVLLICKRQEFGLIRHEMDHIHALVSSDEVTGCLNPAVDQVNRNEKYLSPQAQTWVQSPTHEDLLTQVEFNILNDIASGLEPKQIGHLRGISIKTVSSHKKSIQRKLKLSDEFELMSYIHYMGLRKHCERCD